ncbi:hypothetical protein BDV29DRAFT_104128 [Aspergillus leporis]|uniref:Uncharacterized protein n=1 Tax=Aspergillus leporis TaxID=41062 RepID=A0A5N5X4P2_9EURO|nr:hypothetical protein BDV29DRAFT_104128 [Aspergillus leporis]
MIYHDIKLAPPLFGIPVTARWVTAGALPSMAGKRHFLLYSITHYLLPQFALSRLKSGSRRNMRLLSLVATSQEYKDRERYYSVLEKDAPANATWVLYILDVRRSPVKGRSTNYGRSMSTSKMHLKVFQNLFSHFPCTITLGGIFKLYRMYRYVFINID